MFKLPACLMGLIALSALAACNDSPPDLPTDEEKYGWISTGNTTGTMKREILSIACHYADPPKHPETNEWAAECVYKGTVSRVDFLTSNWSTPEPETENFRILWRENESGNDQSAWVLGS